MISVMAFDPGRTTGYAIACVGEGGYYIAYDEAEMDHKRLWDFVPLELNHIVCESFEFRQGKQHSGIDLYPCELIGVLNLRVQFSKTQLHMQDPWVQGDKKVFFSDAKLKAMGFYLKSPSHGRSAVKHMLYWFQFGFGFQFLGSMKPELVDETWIRQRMQMT